MKWLKARRPWFVTLLSLFAGTYIAMFHLNRGWMGLTYLAAILACLGIATAFDLEAAWFYIPLTIGGAVHSFIAARKFDPAQDLRWYAPLRFCVGLFVLLPIAASMVLRTWIAEPFHAASGSMLPAFEASDYFLANKLAYDCTPDLSPSTPDWKTSCPRRGDVIVFKHPADPSADYLKRVIGLPGDSVQLANGSVILNHQELPLKTIDLNQTPWSRNMDNPTFPNAQALMETLPSGRQYAILDTGQSSPFDNTSLAEVPEGYLFVLGDNRDNSLDSRSRATGLVPIANVIGRATRILWNTQQLRPKYKPYVMEGG